MRLRHIKLTSPLDGLAKLRDLKHLIRERDIDKAILDKFPLTSFGSLSDDLTIRGSQNLLDAFNSINDEKIDILTKLGEVTLIGFDDKNEVILLFGDDITARGCYEFTFEFFEELFDMGKYSRFCLQNDLHDLVRTNFDELSLKMKDEYRQYRIIRINEDYLLRGLTSSKYNNYDNHLALYLTLLALHKYTVQTEIEFRVESADISDSSIRVFFEQTKPIIIDEVGLVYFGVVLSNGEIRDRKFSLELRYKVVDPNDEEKSFAGILTDSVFSINHITKPDNIEHRINGMLKISQLQNSMLEYISSLKNSKTLSADVLYKLIENITTSRNNFDTITRNNIKDLYDKHLINNTLTILEVFNKVQYVITDVDEKICLERIYHELLMDIAKGI
ncbi:hypothetical protein [Desulfosporosinus hippei]|uniref:Uncharacterized protein n=1 Tax=Desulfosporosinus hippei DSM 8344 TaxID=1121419 RepID=A0A1G8L3I1_9FIRM|nr:hypothetical protein [Desulfosporosinus hippei]SDI50243.1 hypothetical protein SAMN05443529_14413 [Desulfosporosinus hippei DSM 8344]